MKQNSSARDVELILDQLNIMYEKEKTFDDLKYKSKLRFDYYLPQYHLCIEFNGIQHYEYVEYFHKDEDTFKEQLFKDYIKRKYCQAHSFHLIELPCSLKSDEIRAELVQFINEHSNEEVDLLPEIESFLKLNESHTVYINQLYDEYKRMLKDLIIDDISNYKIFYNYVIDYWDLKDKSIIKDKEGKYIERLINENVEYNNQQIFNENDNDMMSQFMIELDDLDVFSYSHIPSFVLYEHYKQWLNNINPGSKPMKMIDFTRKLRKQLLNYGYDDSSRLLLSQIENNQFNFDIFEDMYIDFQKKTTVFINHDLTIEGKQEQLEKDAQELSAEVFQSKYDRKQINAYLHYLNDVNGQKLLSLFLDSNTDYTPDQIHDIPNDELVRIVQSQ